MGIKKFFALNAWGPGGGEFWIIRLKLDWYFLGSGVHWMSIDTGLLGFCASLTWYPKGKYEPTAEWVLSYRGEPWIPENNFGREHGEPGE